MNALKYQRVSNHLRINGNATVSSVVKACGVTPRSAKKYLEMFVTAGIAVCQDYQYRSNITTRIYFYAGGHHE